MKRERNRTPPKRGDIFYYDMWKQRGHFRDNGHGRARDDNYNHDHIQTGKRPVVIIQNDVGNTHSPTTIVVPLTTQHKKKWMPTHARIRAGNIHGLRKKMKDSVIMFEHIITVNSADLEEYVGWTNLDRPVIERALFTSLAIRKQ